MIFLASVAGDESRGTRLKTNRETRPKGVGSFTRLSVIRLGLFLDEPFSNARRGTAERSVVKGRRGITTSRLGRLSVKNSVGTLILGKLVISSSRSI